MPSVSSLDTFVDANGVARQVFTGGATIPVQDTPIIGPPPTSPGSGIQWRRDNANGGLLANITNIRYDGANESQLILEADSPLGRQAGIEVVAMDGPTGIPSAATSNIQLYATKSGGGSPASVEIWDDTGSSQFMQLLQFTNLKFAFGIATCTFTASTASAINVIATGLPKPISFAIASCVNPGLGAGFLAEAGGGGANGALSCQMWSVTGAVTGGFQFCWIAASAP